MQKKANYIQQNKAAFFSLAGFWHQFLSWIYLSNVKEFVVSPWASYLLLTACLFYIIGAWLKHLPISYRLIQNEKSFEQIPLLIFLIIGHWLIFFIVMIFAQSAFRSITGLSRPVTEGQDEGLTFFINIIGAVAITWLVFRSKKKKNKPGIYSAGYLFRRELVADILLLFAVSILSFAFWEKGIIALLTYKTVVSPVIFRSCFFFFVSVLCFSIYRCVTFFLSKTISVVKHGEGYC